MKWKQRLLLVLSGAAFLALCHFGGHRIKPGESGASVLGRNNKPVVAASANSNKWRERRKHFVPESETAEEPSTAFPFSERSLFVSNVSSAPSSGPSSWIRPCNMEACFDFSRCPEKPFRHYVYPVDSNVILTDTYRKILEVLKSSPLYTDDPSKACLFVLSLDTLDRDPLSEERYLRNVKARLEQLGPKWNGGQNHVVFNLYSGTHPDYDERDIGFDIGKAILAKASISVDAYRAGFDVSLPLFHPSHPMRDGASGTAGSNTFPANDRYFIAFKGKRYVYGIGSETRNSLHHLHNGEDVVLLTTCKHGKNWKQYKDERCDDDMRLFDDSRWDFHELLTNSTFCLVPRGRRVGSFRFIETLQAGCVPLVLSNGWKLPFHEVIDWSQAAIDADERLLLQVPEILRSIPAGKVFRMRQQTQVLWERYLCSVEKIVMTTLEIIHDRISPAVSSDGGVWNSDPGALLLRREYSDVGEDFPFQNGHDNHAKFTAVIFTPSTFAPSSGSSSSSPSSVITSSLHRLVRNVSASVNVAKIVVLWNLPNSPPSRFPTSGPRSGRVEVEVVRLNPFSNSSSASSSPSQRFVPRKEIVTDAVLALDADVSLTPDEIDFAFSVWRNYPDRITGFPARSHYWDHKKKAWAYTSRWSNEYSMVLTSAAFYHRYYHYLYTEWLGPSYHRLVDESNNCEDILMNFLVSHVTQKTPLKVTQKKQYRDVLPAGLSSPWTEPNHFAQRQTCLNAFVELFGYLPLKKSVTRLDPVLFKDQVSNTRKKYRKIELIPISSGSGRL